MKKMFFAGLVGAALMTSCTATQNAQTAQNNRADFLKLKGDWQITSVDYNKGFKIKPFDEGADAQCFVGSNWRLIPNNYTGSFALNGGGDCPSVSRNIKFEIVGGSEFKFKKIEDGTKAKNNTLGYSLHVANVSENNMTLQQHVPFDGETVTVTYNFVRTGK